ncbi:MAG: Tol-Pal system beta propeller repeat protein TolB [bacterium]
MKKVLYLFVIILAANSILHSQTDVYLKAYTKTFQRMEIDLYPIRAETGDNPTVSRMITEVLSNDLWMSGYFKVNIKSGPPPLLAHNSNGSSDEPSSAIAMIIGKFRIEKGGVTIRPEVLDRASGSAIIRSNYRDRLGNERYLVHKIADDVVYKLTGERGFARSKIAFVTQNKDGDKDIFLMDYDGYQKKQVTYDKSINISPAWSPDGRKICFTSYKRGNPDLYVINLRTNTEIRLSKVKGLNTAPAWSPDGKNIALTLSKDGNAEIYILELDKKSFKRLTFSRAIDSSPSWSPSNREMAFTSDRSGSPQIYIMDADGLNLRRLTYEGLYNDSPAWSPRGDKIAYVSRTGSGFDVYTVDVTGENTMRLTYSSKNNENPSWSPNGFALIFSSNRSGKKELYSMFWDGSDQKKLITSGIGYSPAWSPRVK